MTPEDVFRLVDARTERTFHMLEILVAVGVVLTGVVLLQIVAKVIIWRQVIRLLREVKVLVRIAEAHAGMTDSQKARIESVVAQASEVRQAADRGALASVERHVVGAVERIPAAVVEEVRKSGGSVVLTPGQAGSRPAGGNG